MPMFRRLRSAFEPRASVINNGPPLVTCFLTDPIPRPEIVRSPAPGTITRSWTLEPLAVFGPGAATGFALASRRDGRRRRHDRVFARVVDGEDRALPLRREFFEAGDEDV